MNERGVIKQPDVCGQIQTPELPILKHREEIKEAISENDVVIVVGETGSGKTTEIPLMVRDVLGEGEKMAIVQPRVLAAKSVSRFVAEKLGSEIGGEVGYQVRFDYRMTEKTKIGFMTDGILLNRMQSDSLLSEFSVVMVDEVHERSLNIDLILGNLKRIQQLRKEAGVKPLKIVVASATLDSEKLSKYFNKAPIIEVSGRTYPVEVEYVEPTSWLGDDKGFSSLFFPDSSGRCPDATPLVKKVINKTDGDILIFEPGVDEIKKTIERLNEAGLDDVLILPLHGTLSPIDQEKIFKKTSQRKIIVATNIAETSLTVPGVTIVIDTGLVKEMEFNPETGISSLVVRRQTQDGCKQREGRAGRIEPGKCYRLYSQEDFKKRDKFHSPEIQRLDLAGVVLTMKKIGIDNIKEFEFLDPPEEKRLAQAVQTLINLGALDEEENITELGKQMAELPLEPHLAKMVVEAKKNGCESEVATIVAFLGLKPVFLRLDKEKMGLTEYILAGEAHSRLQNPTSDFLSLLNVWKEYEKSGFSDDWIRENFLDRKVLREMRKIRGQLFGILEIDPSVKSEVSDDTVCKSIAMGLPDNLAQLGYRTHAFYRVSDGSEYYIHPSSGLFSSEHKLITVARIVESNKVYGSFVQIVNPEWVREMVPDLVEIESSYSYNPYSGQAFEVENYIFRRTGEGYFEKNELVEGEKATEAFVEYFSEYLLDDRNLNEKNNGVLERLKEIYVRSGGELPIDTSREAIRSIYRRKLATISSREEYLEAVRKKELNMGLLMDDFISPELVEKTMEENPDEIEIKGKMYKVRYTEESYFYFGDKKFVVELVVPYKELGSFKPPKTILGREVKVVFTDRDSEKKTDEVVSTKPFQPTYQPRSFKPSVENKNLLASIEELSVLEIIEEINSLRQREKSKPRRRALLFGDLIRRGLDEVEKAEISIKEAEAILPELNAAKSEADRKYNVVEIGHLENMIRMVELTILVLEGTDTDSVRTYIGNDPESLRDFRNKLFLLIKRGKEKPGKGRLREMVFEVIEEMTS